jgi:hypothetical protein
VDGHFDEDERVAIFISSARTPAVLSCRQDGQHGGILQYANQN